jgi:predicted N-formylglutamate amidohydrolase
MKTSRECLVFTCEHASSRIPDQWKGRLNIPKEVLTTHHAWDAGAEQLMIALIRQGQGDPEVYTGQYSRLLVDLNRSESKRGVWSEWSRSLSQAEKKEVLELYYRPWRHGVLSLMKNRVADGGNISHLSFHSFTPVWKGLVRSTDIGILYDPGRQAEVSRAAAMIAGLRKAFPDLTIHANQPYRGTSDGHVTELRKNFSNGRYSGIEIEINQRLLPDWKASGFLKKLAQTLGK